MFLDRYLRQYDVMETVAAVDADMDLARQAVRRSDLSRSAVIQVLLDLRSLPNRPRRVLKGRPLRGRHGGCDAGGRVGERVSRRGHRRLWWTGASEACR
jgi:hypothetical protein